MAKVFDQQCVTKLRPEDQILVMQGGMEKRMLVKTLIDQAEQYKSDTQTWMTNEMNTALTGYVTSAQMNTALTTMQSSIISAVNTALSTALGNYITVTAFNTAMNTKQDKIVAQPAIADPTATIATISLLGINIITAAAAQTDRDKIIAILNALRAVGIIVP